MSCSARMAIPPLTAEGVLPPGVHPCSLDEIQQRFGSFQETDGRVQLYDALARYVDEARRTGLVRAVVVDGSFVTAKPDPGDIDLLVVLSEQLSDVDLPPFAYNVISRKKIRRMYPFDALIAHDDGPAYREYVAFFAQVKAVPGAVKGILRVEL